MGTGVQELKHAAKLQEWSARVAECRSSGVSVKAWCREQGIVPKTYYSWERQIVKAATRQYVVPAPEERGMLVQVKPEAMLSNEETSVNSAIMIRQGETVITLPAGSSTETIAELVKALNRHA